MCVALFLFILGRTLQSLSRIDPATRNEVVQWEDGFTIMFRVLPESPKMRLQKRDGMLRYSGTKRKDAELSINFKNVDSAFMTLTPQKSVFQAFAEHRCIVLGDLTMAMSLMRSLNNALIHLYPRMTVSVPPRITAATGMDALSHAVEAYTCLQKNPLSDAYATASIRLISENLLRAVTKSKDKRTRLAMANASTMAGIAFSNSMVGMVHSLGHATGGVAHVPHGEAMSIFLPAVLRYNMDKIEEELSELLYCVGGEAEVVQTPVEGRAERTVELIERLQEDLHEACGLPRTLGEAGGGKGSTGKDRQNRDRRCLPDLQSERDDLRGRPGSAWAGL